ncbi:hypothetical protein ISN45_Aa01g011520 [Arabidopsis thaliana x Arabidopsis arenosa]|uniref:Uncharacterized protein n=1 Tax=Arabidopsis thaliana x Arabidopsis arenosa TaxID=1240361 RepID=A0A8T2CA24_9BRAS|nr:hypothetical protein ISN45_Aa01g011520 [Arabidopsis thaliana x Arabidopsis arenosa]
MDSEIAFDYSPRFRIFKNGRIERLVPETFVPPSLNPENGVVSKDAVYSPKKNLSLRITSLRKPSLTPAIRKSHYSSTFTAELSSWKQLSLQFTTLFSHQLSQPPIASPSQ